MPRGKPNPQPQGERKTCNCGHQRPKSNPAVYCTCQNKCAVGETVCATCQNGNHVY